MKRKIFLDILFIFLLSLTPLLWFQKDTLMIGHDNVFPLNPILFLQGRLSTWIEQGFGQSQALIMGTIPIHFIDALPRFFNISVQSTQKLVYVFWFFLMGVSAYILANTLNKENRVFKLTASVFYIFNFFILQAWWIGERTKFSAYIAFPIILSFFIRVYKGKLHPLKGAIYTSLILFIFNGGGLYGISLFGGFFVAMTVFVIFFSLLSYFKKDSPTIKNIFFTLVLSLIGYLLVNAYFILPAASQVVSHYNTGLGKGGNISGFINWAGEISANASIINIIRLQGIAEWHDNIEHPYAKYFLENPLLILASFLWSLFSFLSLFAAKKREDLEFVLYFFLVFLVGIIFTAGTHPPLGFIYEFFMRYTPGSIAFRSPYFKFAPSIFISTSFLIAYFIASFRPSIKRCIFPVIILLVLLYHFPFFTGNFFSWKMGFSTRLNIPSYVFQFGDWLNNEKQGDGRVLMLPPNDPGLQYSKYQWGYLSFQSISTLLSNKAVVINNNKLNDEENSLVSALYNAILNGDKIKTMELINILQIQYFVLREDTVSDTKSSISLDVQEYKKKLQDFNFPMIKDLGKWNIYEVSKTIFPKIFLASNLNLVSGSIDDASTYYDFLDDTGIFTLREDADEIIKKNNIFNSEFYIPTCLNCTDRNNPFIQILNRNILPDSPLYPLILFRENMNLNRKSQKSLLYDYLGISLKRTGEIREMIIAGKPVSAGDLERFHKLLKSITETFNRLEKYEEKLDVAGDVRYYLLNEKSALSELLGLYVISGSPVYVLGDLVQEITSILDITDPYLFKYDTINNRLYQADIKNQDTFEIYVRTGDFAPVVKDGRNLSLLIDDKIVRNIKLDSNFQSAQLSSFGQLSLDKAVHHFLISFPEVSLTTEGLKPENIEFSSNEGAKCYTDTLKNIKSDQTYRVKINYRNDFSNDLFFYMWEITDKGKNLLETYLLRSGFINEEFIRIFKINSTQKAIIVGLCSRTLTDEAIHKNFSLAFAQVIHPNIALIPTHSVSGKISNVSFTRISPAKYKIKFDNSIPNSVLVFSERFDNQWSLNSSNDHFRINGYANGWVIKNTGSSEAILEYKSEKIFTLGYILSVVSILAGCGYLLIQRKKDHERQ